MNNELWEALGKTYTVETVMTPRNQWTTANFDQSNENRISNLNFDAIPIEKDQEINSFVLKVKPEKECKITIEWIVSCDTSIPDLIDIFSKSQKPVLFVVKKQELIGLVTPADLNKIEARSFLYILIGQFELKLVDFIRQIGNFSNEEIFICLSEDRKTELTKIISNMKKNDMCLDGNLYEIMNFGDFLSIIEKKPILFTKLKFPSRRNTHKNIGGLDEFRNSIMHPIRPLIINKGNSLIAINNKINIIENLMLEINEILKQK